MRSDIIPPSSPSEAPRPRLNSRNQRCPLRPLHPGSLLSLPMQVGAVTIARTRPVERRGVHDPSTESISTIAVESAEAQHLAGSHLSAKHGRTQVDDNRCKSSPVAPQ